MSYHGYESLVEKWQEKNNKEEAEEKTLPRVQIISPLKKLHDIQQVINSLPNKHMNTYELQEAIQNILDGE